MRGEARRLRVYALNSVVNGSGALVCVAVCNARRNKSKYGAQLKTNSCIYIYKAINTVI